MKEIFEAESVAVVGASPNPGKIGCTLIDSMRTHGYKGKVYPVNPKYREILGLQCFPSIAGIPDEVDLVFFVLPSSSILAAVSECKAKGVKALVVVSAGFSEASEEGTKLEAQLAEEAEKANLRILGPNTTGFVSASHSLVASINHFDTWLPGNLAIAGQTGIFAGAYMDEIMNRQSQKLGYELCVSLGNKADIDEWDFVKYASSLRTIKAIQLYVESLKRPECFFKLCAQTSREKALPVILLRGGLTDLGRNSTRAHTGSSGQDLRFNDEYLVSKGIIACEDIEEFFDIAKGFSYQPLPKGRNIGVATMSGANGTLASDAASHFGLDFPKFSSSTIEKIRKFLPSEQLVRNPADIGFVMTTGKDVRKSTMQAVLDDPNIDSLLMIDLPVQNSDYDGVRSTFEELSTRGKPIFLVLQGGKTKDKWLHELEGLYIPVYPTPRRALRVIRAMSLFAQKTLSPENP